MNEEKKTSVFSLEERVQSMQRDMEHMKLRLDYICAVAKKLKDGEIKIRVIK